MATGGDLGSVGSGDLDQLKCQPCLDDGNFREAVGMCIDCQDYLCTQCFQVHSAVKPTKHHQLLDKEQMLQSQIQTSTQEECTEKFSKDKLKSKDDQIKEAEVDKSTGECQIKSSPNQRTLDSLKISETFGMLSLSDKEVEVNQKLKMPSLPSDVAAISNDKLAVTVPGQKNVAIVTVGENNLSVDRYLTVSGKCYGIDYRIGNLAVSFLDSPKVQVLNLQGTVLNTISADKQGNALFHYPFYLAYGQDDTTQYVSNHMSHNFVCVKLDGTVVATYDLKFPMKTVVDSHGNVYVCSYGYRQVHQISKDCKKIRVLLTKADGLGLPYCICLSEEEDKLYVGNCGSETVKVYKTECRPQ